MIAQDALGTGSNPFHRSFQQSRCQEQGRELRIDLVAHPKPAADVLGVNTDLLARDASHMGKSAAHVGHALGREVDVVDTGRRIIGGKAGLRLHRVASDALRIEGETRHAGGARERSLDRSECAIFVFHGEIAGNVGMQLRRARCERIARVNRCWKIAILDDDALGAILRGGFAVRDHERNRLADKAHTLMRKRVAVRQFE